MNNKNSNRSVDQNYEADIEKKISDAALELIRLTNIHLVVKDPGIGRSQTHEHQVVLEAMRRVGMELFKFPVEAKMYNVMCNRPETPLRLSFKLSQRGRRLLLK